MSKILAVTGAPHTGKTTTAVKLAEALQKKNHQKVILLSPDLKVPLLGFLFPTRKEEDCSLGKLLEHPVITSEDLHRQMVSFPHYPDLSALGYALGEEKNTYPRPTKGKILELLEALENESDLILLDCPSGSEDLMTAIGKELAFAHLLLITPDLSCQIYEKSYPSVPVNPGQELLRVLNRPDPSAVLPFREVRSQYKDLRAILPYSEELKEETVNGSLTDPLRDVTYRRNMDRLVKEVNACLG